jgi:hypothetical protein
MGDSKNFGFISELYPHLESPVLSDMMMLQLVLHNYTHKTGSAKRFMFDANSKNTGTNLQVLISMP